MSRAQISRTVACAVCLVALLLASGCGKTTKKLNLYVAAGMKKPMDAVIAGFAKETGVEVVPNYSSSGQLYSQIKSGQPCDLFFSADWLYIDKLQADGKLLEGKKFLRDNLVLIVSKTGSSKVSTVNDLAKPGVVVAIADPGAPVGVYAETALKKLGLWDAIVSAGRLKARPSTVNQLAIMIKNDEIDASLIFSSVANANGIEPKQVLGPELTGEVIFGAGLIKGGDATLAGKFYDYAVKNISEFTKYGWQAYE